jgi:hypothetical protein
LCAASPGLATVNSPREPRTRIGRPTIKASETIYCVDTEDAVMDRRTINFLNSLHFRWKVATGPASSASTRDLPFCALFHPVNAQTRTHAGLCPFCSCRFRTPEQFRKAASTDVDRSLRKIRRVGHPAMA